MGGGQRTGVVDVKQVRPDPFARVDGAGGGQRVGDPYVAAEPTTVGVIRENGQPARSLIPRCDHVGPAGVIVGWGSVGTDA